MSVTKSSKKYTRAVTTSPKIKGFSLVEVLVALTITVIGLVGLSTLQLQVNKSASDTGNRSQAVWMIEDLTNRIQANTAGLADYDTGGVAYNCSNTPKICSDHNDGTGYIAAAADCSTNEQAISDLWEVSCGFQSNVPASDVTRSSAADFIANPQLIVSIDSSARSVTLNLSWDVRTSGTDAGGNTVYTNSNNISSARSRITTVFYP